MSKEGGSKYPRNEEIFLQPGEDPFEEGLPIHENSRIEKLNPEKRNFFKRNKGKIISASAAAILGISGYLYSGKGSSEPSIMEDSQTEDITLSDTIPQSLSIKHDKNRDFWDNPERENPVREEGLGGLESYFSYEESPKEKVDLLKSRVILEYERGRDNSIEHFYYNLITDYNPDTLDYIQEERKEFVNEGLHILKDYLEKEELDIDEENSVVSISNSRSFNLDKTTDLILLDQYIKFNIEREEDKAEDILWFANNGIGFEVRSDALLFIDDDSLVNLSRFLQIGDELGFPRADKLSYIPHSGEDHLAGKHIDGNLYVNDEARQSTTVHEAAHDLARQHPEYDQEAFDKMVEGTALGSMSEEEKQESNGFVRAYGRENNKEDYATLFESYFVNGDLLRSRLKHLYFEEDPGYEILKEKYEFAKSAFEGLEFSSSGEVFEFEEGKAYEVDIPNHIKDSRFTLNKSDDYVYRSFEEPKAYLKDSEDVVVLEVKNEKSRNPFLDINTEFVKVELVQENENGEKELITGWMDSFYLKSKD